MCCTYSYTVSDVSEVYKIYLPQGEASELDKRLAIINTLNHCMLSSLVFKPCSSKVIISTKYDFFDYLDYIGFNLFSEYIGVTLLLLTLLIVALFGCLELCRVRRAVMFGLV